MLASTYDLKPLLKWPGGKRWLAPKIASMVPKDTGLYVEPFLGAGSVLLHLQPQCARVGDINSDLIATYIAIRDKPYELLHKLSEYKKNQEARGRDFYYEVRSLDRDLTWLDSADTLERAARLMYLNRTCFNGLYRVNSKGQFNVPFGAKKQIQLVDDTALLCLSEYLNAHDIEFHTADFEELLVDLPTDAFVYLDPPYLPLTATSNFVGYTKDGFGIQEQLRLRNCCLELRERGTPFVLSQSACEKTLELYQDFTIEKVVAPRRIAAHLTSAKQVAECLIYD